MSTLLERRVIHCPYNMAREYLEENVAPKASSGESVPLKLTVPGAPVALAQTVSVTFATATDPMHFEQPWHIHWEPPSAAYPEFDGELTVRADETYRTARLELKGAYQPPGGPAGKLFDQIAGGRIAKATARALLERIGNDMEARYQRDEDAKRRERES